MESTPIFQKAARHVLFLLLFSHFSPDFSFGQSPPPTDLKFLMTFEQKKISYVALLNPNDFSHLAPLDKIKLRQTLEERAVEVTVNTADEMTVTSVISDPQSNTPSQMPPVKKVVVDKEGVKLYDDADNLLLNQPQSLKYGKGMGFFASFLGKSDGVFGFATQSQSTDLQNRLEGAAYVVQELPGGKVSAEKGDEELVFDFEGRSIEQLVKKDGALRATTLTFFSRLSNGETVPTLTEESSYDVFKGNICYKNVVITRYSDYKIQRKATERGQSAKPSLDNFLVSNIHPNPVSDNFVLQADFPEEGRASVTLLDLHGRTVWQESIWGSKDFSQVFDLQHIEPGVFILDIRQGSFRSQKRLVKI